jgi:Ribonuclease G/E
MGGAFVDIGNSRPSLVDIKPHKDPFIFPPFLRKKKKKQTDLKEKNDNMSRATDIPDEIPDIHSEDCSLKSVHNDNDELETDDGLCLSQVLQENVNGSVVDDELDADFEDDVEGTDVHIEGKMNNSSLPFGMNGSINSHILPTKDTKKEKGEKKWNQVRKGTKIVVQVVKEGLGSKGPSLTASPILRSRFWVCAIYACNLRKI